MIYDRERQKGNGNRATLAVARKMVAYLLAVDRHQRDFTPAEERRTAAAARRFCLCSDARWPHSASWWLRRVLRQDSHQRRHLQPVPGADDHELCCRRQHCDEWPDDVRAHWTPYPVWNLFSAASLSLSGRGFTSMTRGEEFVPTASGATRGPVGFLLVSTPRLWV